MRKKKTWKEYSVIFLMVAITLGFMLPGALYFGSDQQDQSNNNDPKTKVCSSDTDCYLTCDNELKSVMCYQNLCEIDSCEQYQIHKFLIGGLNINLEVIVNEELVNLEDRQSVGNFFVSVSEKNNINLFSEELQLNHVLEKLDIYFKGGCLVVDSELYCNNEENKLMMIVNGEKNYAYENYFLVTNDDIIISYSTIE